MQWPKMPCGHGLTGERGYYWDRRVEIRLTDIVPEEQLSRDDGQDVSSAQLSNWRCLMVVRAAAVELCSSVSLGEGVESWRAKLTLCGAVRWV